MGIFHKLPLGEALELKRGYDLPNANRIEGSIPIVSSSGRSGFHNVAKVKGPGVVTGRYGTIGQVHFIPEDFWPLNTTLYVRDFKGNDPRFISYLLKTIDFDSCSDKAAVPGVNRNHLHMIKILLPAIKEQNRIADILGSLDDKIELNRRMNETLEGMARAIFKSWFIDFDPVHAKAAGRQPEGMDAATVALFPDSFQPSPLGPIPKGWEVKPAADILEVNPKLSLKKGKEVPYVDMKNVPTSGHRVIDWWNRKFLSGSKFLNGDTLFARITPCTENGKTAFIDFLKEGQTAWGSTEFIVLRSKPPFPSVYSYLLARTPSFREHAILAMTGSSGRQRVPADSLDKYFIARPGEAVLNSFGRIANPLFAKIRSADEQNRWLSNIRDLLLPKLLSGEFLCPSSISTTDEAFTC
jgi:type I restriction enzyme S subunit